MRPLDGLPPAQGLYDPGYEHDACGIGFIAHLRGERSRALVERSLDLMVNMSHRSALGGDAETGDGAGILMHLPHAALRAACRTLHIGLPHSGDYGVGMMFLPADPAEQREAEQIIDTCVAEHGCRVLGWRDVPTDDSCLGAEAMRTRPAIRQLFVAPIVRQLDTADVPAFERTLYLLRRTIERALPSGAVYVASLSSRTIIYKGLLRPDQLGRFYRDLADPETVSGLALVHSRFATNTFPSWQRAHPYRLICHNGEINTLRGNVNWMRVREEQMASPRFGDAVRRLMPVIQPDQSDSASLDNVAELLMHAGRPLAHAMAMLMPRAWENDAEMAPDRRAFYEYHAGLMEPWDGPAAIAFTDGWQVGAIQDRNGLRPARWLTTDDDWVVLSSEAGAFPIEPERIRSKGRLQPGTMLVVNTRQGKLLTDDDVHGELASTRSYARWVADQHVDLAALVTPSPAAGDIADRAEPQRLRMFGYTREELDMVLAPMASTGEEPLGSMGNDTPLAVLSERPQLLFSYFRQLFAQVTNPAIDPIRERVVMSLRGYLGARGNVLDEAPDRAPRMIRLDHPVLNGAEIDALRSLADPALRAVTLPAVFAANAGEAALASAVDALCDAAEAQVRAGCAVLILSDRTADDRNAPIPSLLATAAVHHHLIRQGCRSRVSLVSECGDAREVSHIALLIGYGASAVHPYLALAACAAMARDGVLTGVADQRTACERYVKAIEKGLVKILSKMGISTLQSYCGAQIWEAVGLGLALVERHFTGTPSPLGGVELSTIAADVLRLHAGARDETLLDVGGEYHFRSGGERHGWNPGTIATLQRATREGNAKTYAEFSRLVHDRETGDVTLRSMLDFVDRETIPLSEVEPASAIVRRFVTGAMSFGSISQEAHETLASAMNAIGGRSNTGEGGEDPARYGTEHESAIKQVASARFGVTTEYLVNARELQIKVSQGAKPGEGGQLPGHKVDDNIARVRHSTPGVTLVSPPPHHDIYSIEDLKQLIFDLQSVNPPAVVSVKLVAEAGVGTVAAGVAKAGARLVVISGDSGGTGASPLSSIKRAGVPWEIGLSEVQQTLMLNGLRGQIRVQVDGQLKTGRDVIIAALLGAEEFGFATAPLIVEGCVMMRKCHLNTCPVGIATQDPALREKFAGRPEHLVNYFFFVAEEARTLMARLGVRSMDELIGRVDLLRPTIPEQHARARTLDLSALLHAPAVAATVPRRSSVAMGALPREAFTDTLTAIVAPAVDRGEQVRASLPIRNVHRTVGASIAGDIARRYGGKGLPDDTIALRFRGSAGQSFGAFATRGMSLELEGEGNDYVGKGLSGGRIVIHPPKESRLLIAGTPIIGNTALYGATAGEAFIAGAAGERFAVRNSGATAVVEGVGDHGCEYMTGGVVIILGDIGRNFAAGMSGGVAYVLDERAELRGRALAGIELESVVGTDDEHVLHRWIERHARLTGSRRAKGALARWSDTARGFVRAMPVEYKQALARRAAATLAAQTEGTRVG